MSEQVASTSAATTAPTHTEASPAAAAAVSGSETAEHDHEHKKHGLSAVLDKIVHPHGDHKEHSKDHTKADPPIVEVAVPAEASDGGAHLAPAGSGVGGIL